MQTQGRGVSGKKRMSSNSNFYQNFRSLKRDHLTHQLIFKFVISDVAELFVVRCNSHRPHFIFHRSYGQNLD